jgi:hypothetical protein
LKLDVLASHTYALLRDVLLSLHLQLLSSANFSSDFAQCLPESASLCRGQKTLRRSQHDWVKKSVLASVKRLGQF